MILLHLGLASHLHTAAACIYGTRAAPATEQSYSLTGYLKKKLVPHYFSIQELLELEALSVCFSQSA